ncbi:NADH-quinone oxidoreductase subunit J [Uliginosibacterium gangwonense]|uniref:NADH-quinone oxidoreductase subunit J n=1 Tax=Uliginosibacterium gangwonense TaxID=392736 RepID=UPI00036184E1|nr:NADH-quinone oxidoreductase subunit J [Uliginosibacterium gangwonense]
MDFTFTSVCFYLFAAITVFAGLCVITTRNPVHAVLYLVLAFFTTGMIWMLMQAEFLAIAIVLIYIGAVMVLFLFVVMMLDINIERVREGFWRYLPLGLIVALVMAAEMALVLNGKYFRAENMPSPVSLPAQFSNTKMLATLIFTNYAYPFELASLLLLVAMIAAVMLTLRHRKGVRYMEPSEQIAVRAEDRMVVHSIPAQTKDFVETPAGETDK